MSTTTKKVTLENATLVQLVEALAKHPRQTKPELNEAFIESVYRDMCYTAQNSHNYKVKIMDELRAEQSYRMDPDKYRVKPKNKYIESPDFGQGGKMTVLKGGGKSYRGGGALSGLFR